MRNVTLWMVGLAVTAFLGTSVASAADYEYIGLKKCSMCHKKDATGNQLAKWEAGPHSKAFEVLASEESLAEAKKMGIDNPQAEPKCLKCHVTAFPVMADLANQKITLEEGVSCESCHGPGSGYYKKKVMADIRAGTVEAASVGLIEPTEETCLGCHGPDPNNPFHKDFDFKTAVEKIAHPIPEGASSAGDDE